MSDESLRELLARVHERLSASGSVDHEARALLAALTRDIERTLARGVPAETAPSQVPRLEALAVRFEAGHPALAELLRRLIDALVKAGI